MNDILNKYRFNGVLIGRPRAGKTFAAKSIADVYLNGRGSSVMVYSYGDNNDFPDVDYYKITPLTFEEHMQFICKSKDERQTFKYNPKIEYFWFNKQIYHFRDFNALFYNKRVKIKRISSQPEDDKFFYCIWLYVRNTLLIIDDCRGIFRAGLKRGHIDLISALNHTGEESSLVERLPIGIDLLTLWHSADLVNEDFWYYSTFCMLFSFSELPNKNDVGNELYPIIVEAKTILDSSPPHTAIEVNKLVSPHTYAVIKPIS